MSDAIQNRGILVLICFLVALGASLYVGKESLAKQPVKAPNAGGQATSHQPIGQQPSSAPSTEQRVPAAQLEQANRGQSSPTAHHRPTPPQATPHESRAGESAGQQRSNGSPGLHGKPASPPGRENVHPTGKNSARPNEQTGPPPEQGNPPGQDTQTGPKTDEPAPPEQKGTTGTGTAANGSSNRAAGGSPDRQPPTRAVSGHPARSDARPGGKPSYRQAGPTRGISDPRSVNPRSEGSTGLTQPSSAHPSGRGVVQSVRTVDPVRSRDAVPSAPASSAPASSMPIPATPQRPTGEQAQLASVVPFGSTKLLLHLLWDKSESLVEQGEEVLRSLPGGLHDHSTGMLRKGSHTERGPPLEVPAPFSGFGPTLAGAATGSGITSGDGSAPLLAVIAPCLIALLCRGRLRAFCAFLRPGTVPRLALERPG